MSLIIHYDPSSMRKGENKPLDDTTEIYFDAICHIKSDFCKKKMYGLRNNVYSNELLKSLLNIDYYIEKSFRFRYILWL